MKSDKEIVEGLQKYREQLIRLIQAGQDITDSELLILLKAQKDILNKVNGILGVD